MKLSNTLQLKTFKKLVSLSTCAITCILFIQFEAHSKIPITMTGNLPSSIDNSTLPYLRPVFSQMGFSCGSACGIGNVFTFEMNSLRATNASLAENQFPYLFTYHFLNEGNGDSGSYHMFTDAWDIAKDNGIPTVAAWGGFETGYPTMWMNGYTKYYGGMQNRIDQYDSVKITGPASLDTIKQWLFDHGNGSAHGGVAVVTGNAWSITMERIKSGPQTGKFMMLGFGANLSSHHAMTITGYDDSVRYDINGDGSFTNDKDINGDNKVDIKDWEIGALRLVNTWGSSGFGDSGFVYLPYWVIAETPENGGSISDNHIFFCTVKKNVFVKAALKVQINNPHRNQMALSVGISDNLQALSPTKVKSFKKLFTYAGGDFPMGGQADSNTIEIGLDITGLLDSINNAQQYRVFLIVDSKSNTGTISSVTLIDYSSGIPQEYPSSQISVPVKLGKTLISAQNAIATKAIPIKNYFQVRTLQIKNTGPTLEIISSYQGPYRFMLHNMKGQLLKSVTVQTGNLKINTECIARGFYFITMQPLNKKESVTTVRVFIGK